jgi:hypothetical protein
MYITLDKGFTCVWLIIHNIPMIASHISFCRLETCIDLKYVMMTVLKHGCQAFICLCNKKASWCVVNYYSRAAWNVHLQDSKVRTYSTRSGSKTMETKWTVIRDSTSTPVVGKISSLSASPPFCWPSVCSYIASSILTCWTKLFILGGGILCKWWW